MAEHLVSYELFHDLHSQASISIGNLKTLFDLLVLDAEVDNLTPMDGIPDIGLVVAKQGQAELDKIWDKMREGVKDGKED